MDRAVEAWEDAHARASEGGARVCRASRGAMVTVMAMATVTVKTLDAVND